MKITPRDVHVVRMIITGSTHQQIAGALNMSLSAFEKYWRTFRSQMGCKTSSQVVHLAHEQGWLKINTQKLPAEAADTQ